MNIQRRCSQNSPKLGMAQVYINRRMEEKKKKTKHCDNFILEDMIQNVQNRQIHRDIK